MVQSDLESEGEQLVARSHVRLQLGLWRKPGHDDVSKDARFLYVTILGDEALNQAGVVVLRPSVWAEDAAMTDAEVEGALRELETRRFVVIDTRSQALLIRTFIRNDGVADQPNVLRNALAVAAQVRSVKIRRAIAAELRRLPPARPPRATSNGRVFTYPDPHALARELDPDSDLPPRCDTPDWNPSGNPSTNGSEQSTGGISPIGTLPGTLPNASGSSDTRSDQQSKPNSQLEAEPFQEPFVEGMGGRVRGRGRGRGEGSSCVATQVSFGARDDQQPEADELPTDWAPHDGHRSLAAQRGLNLDHEAAQFRAHALDKRRTSWDWPAAFSSWLGRASVDHGSRLRVVNGNAGVNHDPKTGRAVEW